MGRTGGIAVLMLCAGCPSSGDGYATIGGGVGGTRGTTAGTVSSGTSASATNTSGGGTGGAGTTGSGGTCDQTWIDNWYDGGWIGTECPVGTFEVKNRVTDFCNTGEPITAPFTAQDAFHPDIQANTSEGCGVFYFCFDAGMSLTPTFTVPGFFVTQAATLEVVGDIPGAIAISGRAGLGLMCDTLFGTASAAPLSPPLDPNLAMIYVHVAAYNPVGDFCDQTANWTLAALDTNGQVVDAGIVYATGVTTVQTDAGTSGDGVALLYDLDPTLGSVTIQATRQGDILPDGGLQCTSASTQSPWEYTGVVPLTAGEITYYPFLVQ